MQMTGGLRINDERGESPFFFLPLLQERAGVRLFPAQYTLCVSVAEVIHLGNLFYDALNAWPHPVKGLFVQLVKVAVYLLVPEPGARSYTFYIPHNGAFWLCEINKYNKVFIHYSSSLLLLSFRRGRVRREAG